MLLLMQIGDPEKGQFILVDTSEATEENENTTHVSIKGIFTSPFLSTNPLPINLKRDFSKFNLLL